MSIHFIDRMKALNHNPNNYEKNLEAINALSYPRDRKALIEIATKNVHTQARLAAAKKLPDYPQEAETWRKIAMESRRASSNMNEIHVCQYALDQLPYPEERETILAVARDQKQYEKNVIHAIEKLPYEEEKEFIRSVVREKKLGAYFSVSRLSYPEDRDLLLWAMDNGLAGSAIDMLPYPEEKDVYERFALNGDIAYHFREDLLKTLQYPESRKALIRAAKEEQFAELKLIPLRKLPPDREKKVLRETAAKLFPTSGRGGFESARPQDRQMLLDFFLKEHSFIEFPEVALGEALRVYKNQELTADDLEMMLKAAIGLSRTKNASKEALEFLCTNIHRGFHPDNRRLDKRAESADGREQLISIAGWSAAALGRIVTSKMKPDGVSANLERFADAADRYNSTLAELEKTRDSVLDIKIFTFSETARDQKIKEANEKIKELSESISRGPGTFMLDNGDVPFAYLVYILRNTKDEIRRFIKQGVIMGLLDWLLENPDHPDTAQLLREVVAMRAELIQKDNNLCFFEVRVPSGTDRETYAVLLADVLHCANPSVKYCDTAELMRIAEEEVPGVMELLAACPLRLIDPVNAQTLGFYQFVPFAHALWYRYEPPVNVGKVLKRYQEVDDRTRPLSSGLGLKMFTDVYAVIPTLFHEHEHFLGDRNEASVFLKTQMFSIAFYKKYTAARPASDAVFAQMTSMLGMPPAPEKADELNQTIRKYYGKEMTEEAAEKRADETLKRMNDGVREINEKQNWCPEVRYPLLTEEEDSENRERLRDILVRYLCTKKSITEEEFREIAAG